MNELLLSEQSSDLLQPQPQIYIPLPMNGDIPVERILNPLETDGIVCRADLLEGRRVAARAEIAGRLLHKAGLEPSPIVLGEDYGHRNEIYSYVQLTDGRRLAYTDIGSKDHPAVVAFHGNPVGRKDVWTHARHNYQSGVRVITFDRPGYGDSTRDKGHTIWDSALDAQVLVRALGLGRFAVSGRSGGAPAAMAMAALMPEQVSSLSILASIGPRVEMMQDETFDWAEGMSKDNAEKYRVADRATIEELEEITMNHALDIQEDPESFFKMLEPSLSANDQKVIYGSGLKHRFIRAYAHGLAQYGVGWADDMRAISQDWGFRIGDIPETIPVLIWHGREDVHSPYSHAKWIAKTIRHAVFYGEFDASHFDAFMAFPNMLYWHRDMLLREA